MRILAAFLAVLIPACAVDSGEPEIGADELAGMPDVPGDGKADEATDAIIAELTTKYGLRPRKYNGFFNDSNEAERRFRAALPTITAAMNERAQRTAPAIRFSAAELATNFITEGGYYMLDLDLHDTGQVATIDGQTGEIVIDAFTFLGADTAVDNATALRPWLSPEMNTLLADPMHHVTAVNEKGETVHSVYVETIEQGLELNAAMFAWSRQLTARVAGSAYATWPAEAKFFWTTVWYNAGPRFGATQLRAEGVGWWKEKWTSGDDPAKYSKYARYNTLWRTSSWELLSRTVTF